jgi:hypothetical protein
MESTVTPIPYVPPLLVNGKSSNILEIHKDPPEMLPDSEPVYEISHKVLTKEDIAYQKAKQKEETKKKAKLEREKSCRSCGEKDSTKFSTKSVSVCKSCANTRDTEVKKMKKEALNSEGKVLDRGDFISFMKGEVSLYENFTPYEIILQHGEEIEAVQKDNSVIQKSFEWLTQENECIKKEFKKLVKDKELQALEIQALKEQNLKMMDLIHQLLLK